LFLSPFWDLDDSILRAQPLSEKQPLRSKLGIEIVKIIVGLEEQTKPFKVHLNLLFTKVPYLQKMFSTNLKEGEEQKATLPDDSPEAFSIFLGWLYRGSFRALEQVENEAPTLARVQLYCFAEETCQDDLMNYTISSLLRELIRFGRLPKTSTILLAYENALPTSQLRKFLSRSLVRCFIRGPNPQGDWTVDELSAAMSENRDLCTDVLALLKMAMDNRLPDPRGVVCNFYVHEKGRDCPYNLMEDGPLLHESLHKYPY
jgi:hypothetical protein